MNKKQDVRTLCYYCKVEYMDAGYWLKPTGAKYKELCDRCRYRMGWEYVLIARKKR